MNWFKDNQDEWKSIIEIVSSETKKTVLMIEKDIIQSMFYMKFQKVKFRLYFKVVPYYQKLTW